MRIRPSDGKFFFVALVCLGSACAQSDPVDVTTWTGSGGTGLPIEVGGPSGTGGTTGSAGTTGVRDTSGSAGTTGATAGTTGAAGRGGVTGTSGTGGLSGTTGAAGTNGDAGSSARGGTTGTAGRAGSAGTMGTAGRTGTAGTMGGRAGTTGTGGSSVDGGADGGSTPTFTQVYAVLTMYCSGSQCHNPGSQKGISFSSQSTAYNAVKGRVTAGNGAGSSFYSTVNSGSMPPGGPKLSSANLALIKGWIDAGAMNN